MEARAATAAKSSGRPRWLRGALPLAVLAAAIALFVALDAPGLDRTGPPVETLAVERTVLRPGEIELSVRNTGPDPVAIRQVLVNDGFATFRQTNGRLGRLAGGRVKVTYPWNEAQRYDVVLITSTGATIDHTIEAATASPEPDAGFFGLMALIGLYVGVIPVAIGMLWLPWIRGIDARWIQFVLALTVGLLLFLGVDATLEGVELAATGAQAFGGAALVFLGAAVAYLALSALDSAMSARRRRAERAGRAGLQMAVLVSIGIGLHNLGEGLAIGSAYAVGALALGTTLVVGFALHNTTEGLAIVAPVAGDRPPRRLLLLLGLVAGAPAIVGAAIGAAAFNPSLAAFLLGLGAGAIAQVVVQIAPRLRDDGGRLLNPLSVAGLIAGLGLMYVTGLAVSV